MREALSKIFGAELLTLKALGAGGERKGQLIFAVGSEVRRSPTYFTLKRKGKLIGYLFGLMVIWDFSVYDRQGKLRYKSPRLFSQPANSIRIQRKVSDPPWAPYSIMMDSAYYNYSRVVIMRFGLTPPAVRQVFSFR